MRGALRGGAALLDAYGVEYELAPTLVRGLDYYTRTVFEFVNEGLDAAQSTICAGGRYDYLIEEIGGPADARESGGRRGSSAWLISRAEESEPTRGRRLLRAARRRSGRAAVLADPRTAARGGALRATPTTRAGRSRVS